MGRNVEREGVGRYAWYEKNSGGQTHSVGQKGPNDFGLYDMSGNAWEWCQDWSHSDYTGAPADGSAWELPAGTYRVIRGGGWYGPAGACRSAERDGATPNTGGGGDEGGFRLLRTQK